MPYQTGSGPPILDVWHATNVYANNKLIALWQEPSPSPAVGSPEAVTVSLSLEQSDAVATSGAAATSAAEAEVGLAGRGEVPQVGPLEKVQPDAAGAYSSAGGFPVKLNPGANPNDIFAVLAKNIDSALAEAKAGKWKENGKNVCIIGCYKSVGFNLNNDSTPWCAAFAGSVLKSSGVAALKTLSSLAYKGFGTVVPVGDKSKWRLNDIIVFSRPGGGHIGFFRGYNPSNGSVLIAGGNQADNLNEVPFRQGGASMPVVSVSRAWTVPAAYDKPVTFTGVGNSSVKVV
jgi:uncharacterized protein (TIGR02594 family)